MRISEEQSTSIENRDMSTFAAWVLEVGNAHVPMNSIEIYTDFPSKLHEDSYLKQRAILAQRNDDVDRINLQMLDMLPGEIKTYFSADSATTDRTEPCATQFIPTPEYLHSLNFPRIASHCLQLKVGVPITLLRNINPSVGLCNGTRLIVLGLERRTIRASIITGTNKGEIHCIPRIIMSPSTNKWAFILKRRQFPLKLAFAMTINKSQGQTLSKVGIFLPKPVFTRGQLYVALSRATSRAGVKILLSKKEHTRNGYTRNIVFKEVFQAL
ncbi:uncharacterized protein LOC143856650 [Tasmannia lanceolata]|uniref:uncharacterized protein LOC143856650 n=1 Tax=Tasmannia lanceolata TaxID=3420 RepID=UPI004063BD96